MALMICCEICIYTGLALDLSKWMPLTTLTGLSVILKLDYFSSPEGTTLQRFKIIQHFNK
jgi:hypothetical protein